MGDFGRNSLNTYRARVDRVVDADTLDLVIDLGCHVQTAQRIRLIGVDSPERHTEEGKQAHEFTTGWVVSSSKGESWPFIVKTELKRSGMDMFGKFGRLLVRIAPAEGGVTLNEALILNGHGKPYDGGRRL